MKHEKGKGTQNFTHVPARESHACDSEILALEQTSPIASSDYLLINMTITSTDPKTFAYARCCKVIKYKQAILYP